MMFEDQVCGDLNYYAKWLQVPRCSSLCISTMCAHVHSGIVYTQNSLSHICVCVSTATANKVLLAVCDQCWPMDIPVLAHGNAAASTLDVVVRTLHSALMQTCALAA